MTEANKIKYKDLLKNYEITLAKCGWLVLVYIAFPEVAAHEYELRSNGETIFKCDNLQDAVERYNELVV